MPVNIRRLFGIVDDASSGGSEFDELGVGVGGVELKAIPDASIFWPVTGGTLDKNLERIGREDEVRGRRAAVPPLPFRAAPVITVPFPAYRSIVEKILKKGLGGTDTVTGSGPWIHTFAALGFGSTPLPAMNVQLVRDDLNQKMSGGAVNRFTLAFPLDGQGTGEAEIWGLYHQNYAAVAPTPTYTDVDDVMMLRDAAAWFDSSSPAAPGTPVGTAIADLQGFEITWNNNLTRKWYAKRDVSTMILGSPSLTRKLWWPAENKVAAAQDVTFRLTFGNADSARELYSDYGVVQKLVFDIEGGPIAGGLDRLRITIFNSVLTGGGAEALSARDDITSSFEAGAFYSTTAAADVRFEIVNAAAAPIT